jgi:ABC-type lipoprotein export system ATPase subunit
MRARARRRAGRALADEPTGNPTRLALLAGLVSGSATIVMVTHDLAASAVTG